MMYVVSIGGSDSSSGAGVQADVRVCSALGVYCMNVITAVTAQNASSITKVKPMDADTVRAQISALLEDLQGRIVIKISMLYSKSIIDTVADTLKHTDYDGMSVVIDPVLRAGSGRYLLKRDARSYYIEKMVPLATIITPNIMEAEWLSSMKIRGYDDARRAAERITSLGAKSVVIKGGHMQRERDEGKGNDDDSNNNDHDHHDDGYVTDLLYHEGTFYTFTNRRIRGPRLHGAGSVFSAAIAAELAKGNDLASAVRIANNFTHITIMNASSIDGSTMIPLIGNEYVVGTDDDNAVVVALGRAIDILQFTDGIALLIPESQSNLVFAREGAESRDDVAGVAGRIVRYEHGKDKKHGYARAAGPIRYGASKHVADAVLTAMRYDASIRSAMNIRYDDIILDICKGLGLSIAGYDRSKEPEYIKKREGMSVRWGIEQAIISASVPISAQSRVPDVVYHRGDWGKEPMIIVFGQNPMDVLNKVNRILVRYKDYNNTDTEEMEGVSKTGRAG
ncbi:MAG: bifunctional hydroxymethylpyrimidine kinase/phosphomethylpyrimidine kinase [Candidatus Nitrosocaldus sp.]